MSMEKSRYIEHILALNPGASPEWLASFGESELRAYLEHLQHGREPRGARSRWVRPQGGRPIVTRRPAA